MVLATVDAGWSPSSRMLLLKGLRDGEFVFHQHRLPEGPGAWPQNPARCFPWHPLERQVRVEGSLPVAARGTSRPTSRRVRGVQARRVGVAPVAGDHPGEVGR